MASGTVLKAFVVPFTTLMMSKQLHESSKRVWTCPSDVVGSKKNGILEEIASHMREALKLPLGMECTPLVRWACDESGDPKDLQKNGPVSQTYAYGMGAVIKPDPKVTVIVFRGTRQDIPHEFLLSLGNTLDNATTTLSMTSLSPFAGTSLKCTARKPTLASFLASISSLGSMSDQLRLAMSDVDKSGIIIIAGHSLGGGYAQLATLQLLKMGFKNIRLITAGSLKVLNGNACAYIKEEGIWAENYVIDSDWIPQLNVIRSWSNSVPFGTLSADAVMKDSIEDVLELPGETYHASLHQSYSWNPLWSHDLGNYLSGMFGPDASQVWANERPAEPVRANLRSGAVQGTQWNIASVPFNEMLKVYQGNIQDIKVVLEKSSLGH